MLDYMLKCETSGPGPEVLFQPHLLRTRLRILRVHPLKDSLAI